MKDNGASRAVNRREREALQALATDKPKAKAYAGALEIASGQNASEQGGNRGNNERSAAGFGY